MPVSSAKASVSRLRVFGLLGAGALFVGCFEPEVSNPEDGSTSSATISTTGDSVSSTGYAETTSSGSTTSSTVPAESTGAEATEDTGEPTPLEEGSSSTGVEDVSTGTTIDASDASTRGESSEGSSSETGEEPQRCPEGMAYVPGGTFTMAAIEETFTLESFCMDVTPVTMNAYNACSHCSPADSDDADNTSTYCNTAHSFRGEDPANCIDASQAAYYCQSMNKTLPSEEQWEWAARGGDEARPYPWGETDPTADDDPERLCWWAARASATWPNRPQGTCPVGAYNQASTHPFGLEDLSGNVWEWTTSPGSRANDRVVRGGGWDNDAAGRMRTDFRNPDIPERTRHAALGFRCVAPALEP